MRLYFGVHFGLLTFDVVIYFLFISSLAVLQNKSYLWDETSE